MTEHPPHPCDDKAKISGTDTIDQVRMFNGNKILIPVEVDYLDHVCSVCGTLHHRHVLRQRHAI